MRRVIQCETTRRVQTNLNSQLLPSSCQPALLASSTVRDLLTTAGAANGLHSVPRLLFGRVATQIAFGMLLRLVEARQEVLTKNNQLQEENLCHTQVLRQDHLPAR